MKKNLDNYTINEVWKNDIMGIQGFYTFLELIKLQYKLGTLTHTHIPLRTK